MNDRLDAGAVLVGAFVGLLVGGLIALFGVTRSGSETRRQIAQAGQELREQLEEAVTPVDPVAESMAEGKAAARRRLVELGRDR